MYRSNNLSDCILTKSFIIQYEISNLSAEDLHHSLFKHQEIYSQMNLISTAQLTTKMVTFT